MQFTPLGPWGVGVSAGPATAGLKGDSGLVQNPSPLRGDQGGKGVKSKSGPSHTHVCAEMAISPQACYICHQPQPPSTPSEDGHFAPATMHHAILHTAVCTIDPPDLKPLRSRSRMSWAQRTSASNVTRASKKNLLLLQLYGYSDDPQYCTAC